MRPLLLYNRSMATAVVVPLAEYLGQTYHPDREYVDGVVQERNVGEINHGETQSALNAYVRTQILGFWSAVEVRVQVKADRYRIPDVTIVRGGKPAGRFIIAPPEIAVEVLSPDDRLSDVQDKIDDYLAFGVACVWVINPESRRAWIHTSDAAREAKDGFLRNPAGDVSVPLRAVFVD